WPSIPTTASRSRRHSQTTPRSASTTQYPRRNTTIRIPIPTHRAPPAPPLVDNVPATSASPYAARNERLIYRSPAQTPPSPRSGRPSPSERPPDCDAVPYPKAPRDTPPPSSHAFVNFRSTHPPPAG